MGCSRCQTLPCQCVQEPYYVQSPMCAEDHTTKVYTQQMALGLPIQSAWNIPLCGGSAVLSVPGLSAVSVGSYIWHEAYGYFEIIAADLISQNITIQNNCETDNASPGTQVPPCTTFVVTPIPCCDDQTSGVCVELDFTAPAVDACLDITLSSVEGLIVGSNLQIGSGIYRLNEIKSNNVVNICNDGEGITPGTPVIAKNFAGDYQYCIIQLGVNPCTAEVIAEGKVLACGEGNVQAPLDVPEDKGVLIGFDGTTNEAKFTTPSCGLIINGSDELQVDVSGIWGNSSLNYPGTDATGAPIYCATDGRLRTIPKYLPQANRVLVVSESTAWIGPSASANTGWSTTLSITPPVGRDYLVYFTGFAQSNHRIRPDSGTAPASGVVNVQLEVEQLTPAPDSFQNSCPQYVYMGENVERWYQMEVNINRVLSFTNGQPSSFRIRATRSVDDAASGTGLNNGGGVDLAADVIFYIIGVD